MNNLIDIDDLSKKDFQNIIKNTKKIKFSNLNTLKNKNIGMLFENYSTRTRLSFMVAIKQLNGNMYDIKLEDLNLQRTETLKDTFKMFSCYLDGLIYRTKSHENLILARDYFKKPIINALSDSSHPCQALSDYYTIYDHFGYLDNINISWFGDINNVILSLCKCLQFLPNTHVNIFTDKNIYQKNKFKLSEISNIKIFYNIDKKTINESDCIMTDVYTSMNDKKNTNKEKSLKKFQINNEIMNLTKNNCIFMHCLPANIGSEVTDEILNGKKSIVLEQAKNKMYTHKAILKWLNI